MITGLACVRDTMTDDAHGWRSIVRRAERIGARRGLPGSGLGCRLDLGEDGVDHAVEQVLLAAHVVVERHRFDPELLPKAAHAERLDSLTIGKVDRGAEHPLAIQRLTPCGGRSPVRSRAHSRPIGTRMLDMLTPYVLTYDLSLHRMYRKAGRAPCPALPRSTHRHPSRPSRLHSSRAGSFDPPGSSIGPSTTSPAVASVSGP